MPARPVYKALPPPAPVYNWSGFYFGGNVGYLVERDYSAVSNFTQPGAVTNTPLSNTASATAFTGGGQIGFNWQVAPWWVLGVEADWNWTNPSSGFCRTTDAGPPCNDAGRGFLAISEKTDWLASVRGRLGLVWNNVMFYGTGGGAWGRVDTTLTASCTVAGCGNNATANVTTASFSSTKGGWVAGLGAEAMLTPNWTAKVEWLHYDLGNVTATLAAPAAVGSYGVTYSRSLSYDTIRLGLNYKFGWGAGAY